MQVRAERTAVGWDGSLEPVRHRLSSLSQMPADWDSYGGVPPAAIAVEQALGFCRRVADLLGPAVGERALPVAISPLANGGVQLEWERADHLVAVDIGPDGSRGYLKKVGSGPSARYEEDEGSAEEALLALVQEVLLPRS